MTVGFTVLCFGFLFSVIAGEHKLQQARHEQHMTFLHQITGQLGALKLQMERVMACMDEQPRGTSEERTPGR